MSKQRVGNPGVKMAGAKEIFANNPALWKRLNPRGDLKWEALYQRLYGVGWQYDQPRQQWVNVLPADSEVIEMPAPSNDNGQVVLPQPQNTRQMATNTFGWRITAHNSLVDDLVEDIRELAFAMDMHIIQVSRGYENFGDPSWVRVYITAQKDYFKDVSKKIAPRTSRLDETSI
jgi:hypothetical protein